jgi:hypothetical protein
MFQTTKTVSVFEKTDQLVMRLNKMGFPYQLCIKAVEQYGDNPVEAVNWLTQYTNVYSQYESSGYLGFSDPNYAMTATSAEFEEPPIQVRKKERKNQIKVKIR